MTRSDRPRLSRTRSLLTRTVVSVLLVMTGLLVVLGVSVDTALGSRLRGEIEQRLQDRIETAQALSGSVDDDSLADRLSGQGVSAYVRTADGTVHTSGPSPEEISTTAPKQPPPTRGPASQPRPAYGSSHQSWCQNRWRSYRAYDNTYQPNNGPRRQCVSPY